MRERDLIGQVKTNHPPTLTVCIKGHCSVTPLPGWICTDLHPTVPQGMSRSSSLPFIRSFSAESPSSSFSDSRVNGAELKEGAAQPLLGRPPPEPPDPEMIPGQENNETDQRRLRQHELMGRTAPHPATPTVRQPLRSLSLNSPRESIHQSRSISCTKVATPINSKQPPLRLDSRSQRTSQGSLLPSTPPISVQAFSTSVSEVTKTHAHNEMVLCNSCAILTPFLPTPDSDSPKLCRKELLLLSDALPTPLSMSVSQLHRSQIALNSRSQHLCECQHRTAMHQPIVDNSLYIQQCIIRQGAWKIDDKVKAPISIYMESCQNEYEPLIDSHPVARCILDRFRRNFRAYRGDIEKRRKKPQKEVAAKQCTTPRGKLLTHWMDSSTERLECAFAEKFQTSISIAGPWACGCDITIPILAVMLFRSAFGVSVSLEHFVNSCCHRCHPFSHRVQWTLIKLKEAHDNICVKLDTYYRKHKKLSGHSCECPTEDIAAMCNDLNIIYKVFPTEETENWLIEYPHFVEIHLRPHSLGKIHILCLYMQIPPFCFAVPLFKSDGSQDERSCHLLESHFKQIVLKINTQLLVKQNRFFEKKPELRNNENLGLIYPYHFDCEAECRHLRITIDTRVE